MGVSKTPAAVIMRQMPSREHRSITKMELLIRDHCGRNGISIREPQKRPRCGTKRVRTVG
jgi:hypothetical protein